MTTTHDRTHASSVFVAADFQTVRERITDPLEFPALYPIWTTDIERINEDHYRGLGPAGDEFVIRPFLDRKHGIVDFDIEAGGTTE